MQFGSNQIILSNAYEKNDSEIEDIEEKFDEEGKVSHLFNF